MPFSMPKFSYRRRTFWKASLAILTLGFMVTQFRLLLAVVPEAASSSSSSSDNERQYQGRKPAAVMIQDLRDFSTSKNNNNVENNDVGHTEQKKATLNERPVLPKPGVVANANNTNTTATFRFHGIPLAYIHDNRPSDVHCVGENFLPSAWFYRSCQFRHLCYDMDQQDFVVFQSEQQKRAEFTETFSPYARSSTNFQQAVSSMGKVGKEQSKWFPRTVPLQEHERTGKNRGYYQLPLDIVWAPFSTPPGPSLAENHATSRLLMDYAFPIFNLLSMFGLENRSLLLTTFHSNDSNDQDCSTSPHSVSATNCTSEIFRSILPLMKLARGHSPLYPTGHITGPTNNAAQQQQGQGSGSLLPLSGLVCAQTGVAGIGALTDHGTKQHGELKTDYHYAQNTGRGPLFWAFRNYILGNLGLTNANTIPNDTTAKAGTVTTTSTRHTMTVAVSASAKSGIQYFRKQQEALQHELSILVVQEQDMSKLTLRKQIEMATQSTFYLSVMGEGAIPAFFMPRGATLIIYYNNRDELVQGRGKRNSSTNTALPAMMDWDLWNNLSHLRVHWLPLKTMNDPKDLQVLVDLVQNEIGYLSDRDTLDRREPTHSSKSIPANGTFSGLDVRYVDRARSSTVHCVGDNFEANRAFYFRSCEIQHLCMDTGYPTKHFEIYASQLQLKLNESIVEWKQDQDHAVVSSVMDTGVMEGRPVRFADDAWFPSVTQVSGNYYELPSDVVWIPFTAEYSYAKNPGHLMWDYFLPFYTLLSMYGMEDKRLLLTSIDPLCMFLSDCKKIVTKFLPLMGASAQELVQQHLVMEGEQRSSRVCARHGATGIGMLTDHGFTRHGQNLGDYKRMHNAGRGSMLYAFRGFLLRNMKIKKEARRHARRRISFSINSSTNPFRRKDFSKQITAVNDAFPNSTKVEVKAYEMAGLTLEEQIECIMDTSVFVSVIGGSTSIASFLPRGSTLILFFNDENSFVGNTRKKDTMPTMMDFDFWNNAAYVRVHWLPTGSMNEALGTETLVRLIENELSITNMIK